MRKPQQYIYAQKADEVAARYQSAMAAAKAESEREIDADIKEIKVSRVGPINRLLQNLARRGVL